MRKAWIWLAAAGLAVAAGVWWWQGQTRTEAVSGTEAEIVRSGIKETEVQDQADTDELVRLKQELEALDETETEIEIEIPDGL